MNLSTFYVKYLIVQLLFWVLSFSAKVVLNNEWPTFQELLLMDPWWMAWLEWATVLVLVYLGYSIPLVAVSTFILISIAGYVARKFLN